MPRCRSRSPAGCRPIGRRRGPSARRCARRRRSVGTEIAVAGRPPVKLAVGDGFAPSEPASVSASTANSGRGTSTSCSGRMPTCFGRTRPDEPTRTHSLSLTDDHRRWIGCFDRARGARSTGGRRGLGARAQIGARPRHRPEFATRGPHLDELRSALKHWRSQRPIAEALPGLRQRNSAIRGRTARVVR